MSLDSTPLKTQKNIDTRRPRVTCEAAIYGKHMNKCNLFKTR